MRDIGIIGGGAAGFFLAANLGKDLGKRCVILEKTKQTLQKVKISGGGRCNVTHACFDPNELIEFYPRGKKELRSVFHQFQPGDTMEWFQNHNVALKIEDDNRVFPVSNQSASIIHCLKEEVQENGVKISLQENVSEIQKFEDQYIVKTGDSEYRFQYLILCTGSSKKFWDAISPLALKVISPVPSLFTFNCKDDRITNLPGTSFKNTEISIPNLGFEEFGDLLITHWGFSGPGILKLSAKAALELHKIDYVFSIKINFIQSSKEECIALLNKAKSKFRNKKLSQTNPFILTKRFWTTLLDAQIIPQDLSFANLSKRQITQIATQLCEAEFMISGKSTFKDEFVTAGGINLKEVDFKNMESKQHKNLFFAGEILNIDAYTGGFNFQACWSEAFVISKSLKNRIL